MVLAFIPDPFRLCRELLDRVENGVNELATRHMDSPRVVRAMFGASKVALGARHFSEKTLEALYRRLELPSRSEVETLAAAVRRVEDKLDMLLPASAKPPRPARPARTRRPAPAVAEATAASAPAKSAKRPAKPNTKSKAKPLPQRSDATPEVEGHGTAP